MRHSRLILGLGIGGLALGAAAMLAVEVPDRVLYNGSPSMPVGFYLRTSAPIAKGAIVTVRAVDVAPRYAAQRHFSGRRDRFLKHVAGVEGDVVCASGSQVTLNRASVADRLAKDSAGRALPRWEGCVTLSGTDVFVLGETADSFDGRYWGPTPTAAVEGVWRRLGP